MNIFHSPKWFLPVACFVWLTVRKLKDGRFYNNIIPIFEPLLRVFLCLVYKAQQKQQRLDALDFKNIMVGFQRWFHRASTPASTYAITILKFLETEAKIQVFSLFIFSITVFKKACADSWKCCSLPVSHCSRSLGGKIAQTCTVDRGKLGQSET